MPDWAVVLLAAFGGGLAGSVLQPVVSHVLERVRREEGIRRRRERSLRQMLQSRIKHGQIDLAILALMAVYGDAGQPVPSVSDLKNRLGGPAPARSFWAPSRISDPQLQRSATEYDRLYQELQRLIWARPVGEKAAFDIAETLEDQFAPVEADIIRRMDELNWPEVDD